MNLWNGLKTSLYLEDKNMTKKEACHKLAYINERIYDLKNSLSDIESRLRWDDESRKDW